MSERRRFQEFKLWAYVRRLTHAIMMSPASARNRNKTTHLLIHLVRGYQEHCSFRRNISDGDAVFFGKSKKIVPVYPVLASG